MWPWIEREVSGCSPEGSKGDDAPKTPAPNSSQVTSPSTTSMRHPYADKNMLRFMEKLASTTNASKWIDLPMICVLGDTSSGKSSLLSNLSMVEFPASQSLTTKCPILLQMSRADRRQASVRIQWRSSKKQTDDSNGNNDPGMFEERTITEDAWATIPSVILEAQQHILNTTHREVAQDVVSLYIEGPDCSDLMLLDLPGLVRSKAEDESENFVHDVQSLLAEYLENRRCVILAVVPANVDFHNSQIIADALRVDPSTSRTIPVITKADLIDKGGENDVLELLLGKKVSFSLGFHMVKGRGQAALDSKQTVAEGLKDETDFFTQIDPWKSVEDRSLFGTDNLRVKLAQLQMTMIRHSLPEVLREIRQKQSAAKRSLDQMGDILVEASQRRKYYQEVCQSLVAQLKSSLSGKGRASSQTPGSPSAAASLHEAIADFADHIRAGSLANLNIVTEGGRVLVASARGPIKGEVVHLEDDFACVDFVDEKDAGSDVLFDYVGSPTQEVVEENEVWSDGSKICIARKGNLVDTMRRIPLSSIRTDPSWLREKIRDNRTDDLACFLPAEVFTSIVSEFIDDEWKAYCLELLDKTRRIVLEAVDYAVSHALRNDRYPELRDLLDRQCRQVVKEMMSPALKQILSYLEVEKHPYTSLSEDLFQQISAQRQARLRQELEVSLRLDQEGVYDTQAIKTIIEGVFERCQQQSAEDYMAEELERVLASYGSVVTNRMLDRVPMISWQVFRDLTPAIQESLWIATDDSLQECMQDDPEFSARFQQLKTELDEMNSAIEIFESIA